MLPKEELYGNPISWMFAPESPTRDCGCKIAPWKTLGNAILGWGGNPSVLPLNEQIDNSISFCGIAADSPISTIHIIDYTNTVELDKITPPKTDWCLSYYDSRYLTSHITYHDGAVKDDCLLTPIEALGDTNPHRFLRPIVDIEPAECIIYVTIEALNSTATGNWIGSVDDYEQVKTQFPFIKAIWGTPYSRVAKTDSVRSYWLLSQDYTGAYISRLIDYPVTTPQGTNWGNVVNYTANSARNVSSGSGNNTFVIWGYNETYDTYVAFGGKDDELDSGIHRLVHRQYSKDWVCRCAASLGLFFTLDENTAINGELDDINMYCGIIDENGLTHGDYSQGIGNREQKQYDWKSTAEESDYDPTKNVDPNIYETKTELPYPSLELLVTPYNVYIDRFENSLLSFVVANIASLGEMSWKALFIGQEPLSNIIGSRRVYIKPPAFGGSTTVKLGAYDTNITTHSLINEWVRYELGSKKIYPKHGNFLDYEPYTTISLYVPYCGSIKLPTATFMNHNCKLTLNVNARTGDMDCLIFVDEIEYATLKGNCAVDMAVSGLAMSEYAQRERELQYQARDIFWQGIQSTAGHLAGASISASMGNATGIAIQGLSALSDLGFLADKTERLKFELEHIAPDVLLIQKASSNVAPLNVAYPYIFIERPIYEDGFNEKIYSKTVGHQCYKVDNLQNFKGLTVCADAKLDGLGCTLTEVNMILAALQEGVILDEPE